MRPIIVCQLFLNLKKKQSFGNKTKPRVHTFILQDFTFACPRFYLLDKFLLLMAKKPKNPLKNGNPNNLTNSNPGSYFKTLFGEIPEQNSSSISLFSENNPFRRKVQETRKPEHDLGLEFGAKDVENKGTLENPDFAELKEKKKRKKEREKKESFDLDTELIEEESKKLKRTWKGMENNGGNNSGEYLVNGGSRLEKKQKLHLENANLPGNGISGDFVDNGQKKKKRKRDEVEAEYEAKLYGVADEEENKKGSNAVGGKRKKMDNPEDTMVSKEGFDDESKLLRTVFVGNLQLKIKKKELVKEFGKFGEVESVRIRSVPIADGKIPRKGAIIQRRINENGDSVHAYIVFKTEESAQASLAHNMAVVGGNHIRVDRACPPRKKLKGDNSPLYENKRTVFVGNLPFDVKDEEIYQLFSGVKNLESSIEAVRVIRDPGTSLGKGIAYVLFKTKDAANSILMLRNLKLRDRRLRLTKSSDTPLKRKNFSTPETKNYPAKNFAVTSRTPDGSGTKVKAKENLSYQGVRSSKSGTQKKVVSHTRISEPVKSKFRPATEQKLPKKKRPAVAARKKEDQKAAAKRESNQGASGSKLVGTKRKFGNRTPESAGQKKKARKFK